MTAANRVGTLPLPYGRPRRVRSAVVHAVSLAQAYLTVTRGWAAISRVLRPASWERAP